MNIKKTYLYRWLKKIWCCYSYTKNQVLSTFFPKYNTQRIFKATFGRTIDFKHPTEINDKIQWLKFNTYYRNDVITRCVDKYRVREYLEAKGMGDLLPRLYGVYTKGEDIEWQICPKQFVIKCNHGCGYNILCADMDKLNQNDAVKRLNRWMREDYWKNFAEVQYKYVEKKIIVEEYLGDNLVAYKFYCFNGVPKFLYISSDGNGIKDYYLDYFDMNWNRLSCLLRGHEHYPGEIDKPESFEKMKDTAEKLSGDFPFVRVDLYDVQGEVYFSELTFIPTGGFMKLEPQEVAKQWGELLELPLVSKYII